MLLAAPFVSFVLENELEKKKNTIVQTGSQISWLVLENLHHSQTR